MCRKSPVLAVMAAAMALSLALVPARAQGPLQPKTLAIYYGYPSLVNGSAWNAEIAAAVFDDYDAVVFGDGLQNPAHPDHANTTTIIALIKASPNHTAAYGYVPLGVENLPGGQVPLSVAQIYASVDAWTTMGVSGIFFDQAGYDFCVSRERQNQVVDYVHSNGLAAFVNAWSPDDVFGAAVTGDLGCATPMNPDMGSGQGTPALLSTGDTYLFESFQVMLGEFQDPPAWAAKADSALAYHLQTGTKIAAVTTVDWDAPGFDQAKFDYAWWSAALYGFDMLGWGELYFSAADNALPYRVRPSPGDMGAGFTAAVVTHNGDLHTRTTTAGTIEVHSAAHTGRFVPAVQTVTIDIKPGDVPNTLNPKSKGQFPVAIISTASLDAASVNPASVRFGATGIEATPLKAKLADVDGDGDLDLRMHFETQQTGIRCGDTRAMLSAATYAGLSLSGSDSIVTVGCGQ